MAFQGQKLVGDRNSVPGCGRVGAGVGRYPRSHTGAYAVAGFLIAKERRFASPDVFCQTNMNNPAATFNSNTAAMLFALIDHGEVGSSTRRLAKKSIDRCI
jgi:hypothetical protein